MFGRKKTNRKKTMAPKIKKKVKPKPKKKTKVLFNAKEEKRFWLCDGQVLKNLKDLAGALEKMDDKVFKYHVNKKKNDFASWIKDVIKEPKLAKELKGAKTAETTANKIKSSI